MPFGIISRVQQIELLPITISLDSGVRAMNIAMLSMLTGLEDLGVAYVFFFFGFSCFANGCCVYCGEICLMLWRCTIVFGTLFFFSFNMSVYALACVVDWAAKWSARSTGVRGPKLSIDIGFLLFLMIDFIFLTMYRWCDEWTGRYKDMLCKRKAKKYFDWKNNSFIMSISNTYNSLSIIIHLSYMILLLIVQWYIHKIVTK